MARPKLKLDAGTIERLAAIACTTQEIADVLECSPDTIERRFAGCLKKGRATARTSLRRMQWKAAEKGNATLLIWLGKQLLGQTDQPAGEDDPGGMYALLAQRLGIKADGVPPAAKPSDNGRAK